MRTATPETLEVITSSSDKRTTLLAISRQHFINKLCERDYTLQSTLSGGGRGGVDNDIVYGTLVFSSPQKL